MNKHTISLLLIAALLGSVHHSQAAGDSRRVQLHKIESLQRRADILAAGKLGPDNYHLAKARSWLDLALSEYYEGESSEITPSAIEQARRLLDALENKQTDIGMDTPRQVKGSEAVRADLWRKIAALKDTSKVSCGLRPLAEAEVLLVWAGHKKLESSWAQARPYAHSAADLIREVQAGNITCAAPVPKISSPIVISPPPEVKTPPPVAKVPAPAVEIPAPVAASLPLTVESPKSKPQNPPSTKENFTLASGTLFEFGKASLDPSALWQLDRLVKSIRKVSVLEDVVLTGHTDRLRSDGHPERNQILSEKRAESVKRYLIRKQIPAAKIHASGAGSSLPLVECPTDQSKEKQIICLKPNRRVEIVLRGTKVGSAH